MADPDAEDLLRLSVRGNNGRKAWHFGLSSGLYNGWQRIDDYTYHIDFWVEDPFTIPGTFRGYRGRITVLGAAGIASNAQSSSPATSATFGWGVRASLAQSEYVVREGETVEITVVLSDPIPGRQEFVPLTLAVPRDEQTDPDAEYEETTVPLLVRQPRRDPRWSSSKTNSTLFYANETPAVIEIWARQEDPAAVDPDISDNTVELYLQDQFAVNGGWLGTLRFIDDDKPAAPPAPRAPAAPPSAAALKHPKIAIQATGDAGPVAVGDAITYQLTVTNTGNVPLSGVFWRSPELGVGRRLVGDGTLAPNASVVAPVSFGPVAPEHRPGPIIVTFFADSDQTDDVPVRQIVPVAPAPPPPEPPAPAPPAPAPAEAQVVLPPVDPGATVAPAESVEPPTASFSAEVLGVLHWNPDAHLQHNLADLLVTRDADTFRCDFCGYFLAYGGLARWGYPTSEVIEEEPGVLTQYFQRGVLDCRRRNGQWLVERRLAWDYLGGGLAGAPDLGVEPALISDQPGELLGPWGHRVSNLAVDGTPTGFLEVFEALGGVASFGYPKSEARADDDFAAGLQVPGAAPGIIRQVFQAAVMEYHPGDPEPVQLLLIGDLLRDRLYPDQGHAPFASFGPTAPQARGDVFTPERVVTPDSPIYVVMAQSQG